MLEVSAAVHDCSQKTVWHCEIDLSDKRTADVPFQRHLHDMTQCSVLISNTQNCWRFDQAQRQGFVAVISQILPRESALDTFINSLSLCFLTHQLVFCGWTSAFSVLLPQSAFWSINHWATGTPCQWRAVEISGQMPWQGSSPRAFWSSPCHQHRAWAALAGLHAWQVRPEGALRSGTYSSTRAAEKLPQVSLPSEVSGVK